MGDKSLKLPEGLRRLAWAIANEKLSLKAKPSKGARRKIKKHWQSLVTKEGLISMLTLGQKTKARPGYGLIYIHRINGKVRYIGQTSKRSLMEYFKQQSSKSSLRAHSMRYHLLKAFWKGSWEIRTEHVKLRDLRQRKKELIKFYGRLNNLWNKRYNPHFKQSNIGF